MEKQLGYVLNRNGLSSDANGQTKRYFRRDLERMTVYQLREIAQRERVMERRELCRVRRSVLYYIIKCSLRRAP